jgi:ribosomal protein S18 acetylase RimI-like enzyme
LRELSRAEVETILRARREELVALWPDIRGTPLHEIIAMHVDRDGFRFVAEQDDNGRLAGIAYGYRGETGQWWHDMVAAEMTADQRRTWLAPGHFELAELAVRPDLRGRGIGGGLHDAVLEGEDGPALLSTQVDNEPALALYRGRGWTPVVPAIEFEWGTYCVMGLAAPSGREERVDS